MLETILLINISTNTLCASHKCWPIISNEQKTLKKEYTVESIYFNADMRIPTGDTLKASEFGGIIIDLVDTDIAIHSWLQPFTPQMQSSGCIRMNKADLEELINNYYFNKVIVTGA